MYLFEVKHNSCSMPFSLSRKQRQVRKEKGKYKKTGEVPYIVIETIEKVAADCAVGASTEEREYAYKDMAAVRVAMRKFVDNTPSRVARKEDRKTTAGYSRVEDLPEHLKSKSAVVKDREQARRKKRLERKGKVCS